MLATVKRLHPRSVTASDTALARKALSPRLGGFLSAALLIAGLALIQVLIGGTRLLFSFPAYSLIAIAALIAVALLPRPKTRTDFLCLCASGIFFGYIIFRALASPIAYSARPDLYSVLAALTVYGLTILLSSSTMRMALIVSLMTLAVPHVLIGVIQFSRGDNFMLIPFLQRVDYGHRASGFYVCPNHLAGLLEVLGIFGLSISCWSRWPVWSKLLIAYLVCVCYAGVALTASRGGYLSVAASLIVFTILSLIVLRSAGSNLLLKFGLGGLVALTAALIAVAFLFHQSFFLSERAGNIVDTKNIRLSLWHAAIQQWKLQPLWGTGSGTYRFYGRQFRTEDMQLNPVEVHNDYLHLLCEYGVAGGTGFLLFFFAHLRYGLRGFTQFGPRRVAARGSPLSDRLALNIGALSAIAAYVVHSVVDFNLHIPANALLLAFVFGLVANPGIKYSSHSSESPRPAVDIVPQIAIALLGIILLLQCTRLFLGEYYAEHARTALLDENPSAAIAFANKALIHEKQNPDIYFYLGRALTAVAHQKNRPAERAPLYEGALAAFEEATRLAPLDGTYPTELACTYDEIGRFAEAEQQYAIARSRDPRSTAISQLYQFHLESWQKDGKASGSQLF